MNNLVIMPDLSDLIKSGKGTNQGSKRIADFKAMKPTLHKLVNKGEGFFIECAKVDAERRDFQFILNKYGMIVGKKFAVVAQKAEGDLKKAGIWIILAEPKVDKAELSLTEGQVTYFGDSLTAYTEAELVPKVEAE